MNRFQPPSKEAPPRKCSECGHELYADEDMICQECLDEDKQKEE